MEKIFAGIIFILLIGFQVSAQSVLSDDKIAKDLVITLSSGGTIQFSTHYTYRITSDGKVFYEEQSNLPPRKTFTELFSVKGKKIKQKKLDLENKFSKKQIKEIIFAFEKAGFFEISDDYNDKSKVLMRCSINHVEIKGLSISANGKMKEVYFSESCSDEKAFPLKNLLILFDKISKKLSGVKKFGLKNQ